MEQFKTMPEILQYVQGLKNYSDTFCQFVKLFFYFLHPENDIIVTRKYNLESIKSCINIGKTGTLIGKKT